MIRVLHSVSNMDRAGIETMLMNYYRNIDRNIVQFDFCKVTNKPVHINKGRRLWWENISYLSIRPD